VNEESGSGSDGIEESKGRESVQTSDGKARRGIVVYVMEMEWNEFPTCEAKARRKRGWRRKRNVPAGETKKIRKNKLSERRTERRKKKKEAG
jgi:hypothetical protein